MKRHPANEALDEWLRTSQGQSCAAGKAEGQYMQNRLYWAFMAGWNANESSRHVKERPTSNPQGQSK